MGVYGFFTSVDFGVPYTVNYGNFCFGRVNGDSMINTERLCLGCMSDCGEQKVCEVCGYDSSTRNPQNALPTKQWLNDRYYVGKVISIVDECIAYIGCDKTDDSIVTVYEYFPNFAIRNPDKTVSVAESDKYSFNGGLLKFIEYNKTLNGLELPSLIPVKDIFEENGTAYVVKPSFKGITLCDFLNRNGGSLKWEQARPLFLPLMDTLKAMHDLGIIVGSISPDTILVGRDGKLRLSAVNFWNNKYDFSANTLQAGFSAVEQYKPEEYIVTVSADVYALSAVLFNVLIGNIPPSADLRIENDGLSVPSKFAEELPRNVLVALANGIQVLPEKRTKDIDAFRNELVYGNSADGSDINSPKKAVSPTKTTANSKKQKSGGVKSAFLAAICTAAVFFVIIGVLCLTVLKDYVFPKEEVKKPSSSVAAPSSQVIGSVDEEYVEAPKQYTVPDFVGKWYADVAEDKESEYENFTITIKDKVFSDKYSKGTICEQSVKSGSDVEKGTEIQLTISMGPQEIKVTNVIGLDEDQAKMELLKQGFIYENIHVEEFSDSEAKYGKIVKQEPEYGTTTNTDIAVTIYVNIENKEEESDSSSTNND